MAKLLKLRRGTTSQHSSFTGAEGEVTVDTDKETLVVHNGSTAGGFPVARADGTGVANFTITGELDAATLDISGNADIDGTLEADAITVNGTALSTVIAGTTVTNATNAAGLTGTPNVTVGVVTAGSLDISGNADIDGTLEADAYTVNGTALDTHIAGVTVTNATNAANVTVTDNENSDQNNLITFINGAAGPGTIGLGSDGDIYYNPSSGLFSVPAVTTTGNVTIGGNLQVDGTTTTVNSTTMTVVDKNIEIAKGAANDAAADGAGITVDSGDGDKTWNWVDATDAWTSSEHIHVGDNKKLLVGTGGDLDIHHDGTDSIIDASSANLFIKHGAEKNAVFTNDGAVELYHDNVKKFETTNTGANVLGTFSCNSTINLYGELNLSGTPQDKYFDASITDGSTDYWMSFRAVRGDDASEHTVQMRYQNDGAVELNYDGSKKFETTSSGVTVTGSVTDSKGELRTIPQLSKSSKHTIVLADAGKHSINSSGGWELDTSTAFTAGMAITLINNSGSDQTIEADGVTLYNTADAGTGYRTFAGRGMATVICTASNTYYISGAGLS